MTTEGRIVITQGVIISLALALCWLYRANGLLSVLAGGGCALLPTIYAAIRSQATSSTGIWGAMLLIQTGKMVLMSALFVASFVLVKPLDAVAFFVTFICCQGGFIIGAWFAAPMASVKPPEQRIIRRSLSGKHRNGH